MTNDPRLPTVEQVLEGLNRNPRELVDTPMGRMERWCAETMLIGQMKGALSVFDAIRSDSTIADARADAVADRDAEIRGQIVKLVTGLDSLTARVDSIEAEIRTAKADAARKAKFDEEELVLPPDIAEKQASAPPAKIENDTHQPSGELHSLSSKEEPEDPDFEFEDDTSRQGSDDTDNEGDLPPELTKDIPPAPSTYPNFELPKPPVVSQPVAISLNEE